MALISCIGPGRGRRAPFSLVVVESGWQECTTGYLDDARLWQEASGNAVRVVLQAKFHEASESGCCPFLTCTGVVPPYTSKQLTM